MRMLPIDYATRNLGRRPLRTALLTAGAAIVVSLVILMTAFVQSVASSTRDSGEPENVIVLGTGSENFLEQSEIGFQVPTVVAAAIGSIRTHGGQPVISPEIHHAALIRLPGEDEQGSGARNRKALVRGVTDGAYLVHPKVFITSGRTPATGEVLVGRLVAAKLRIPESALRPGAEIDFEGRTWKVSGTFEAPGTVFESEIWAPLEDLKVQVQRTTLTCVIVALKSPQAFSDVEVLCKTRLDLELAAVRESAYYGALARLFRPMQVLGWVMALLLSVSGLFGGMNAMIAAVASRARELACIETQGFSRLAITVSLLQESLVQAGAGALLAVGAALSLSGAAVQYTMNAFALEIGPQAIFAGLAAAIGLALGGTLVPTLQQLRTSLAERMRS